MRGVHGPGTLNLGAHRLAPLARRSWEKGADEQARTRLARRGRNAGDQGRRRATGRRRVLRHRRRAGPRGARDYRGLRKVRHTLSRSPNWSQSPDRGACRHRGLKDAVVQTREGPSRHGQRIAAWNRRRSPPPIPPPAPLEPGEPATIRVLPALGRWSQVRSSSTRPAGQTPADLHISTQRHDTLPLMISIADHLFRQRYAQLRSSCSETTSCALTPVLQHTPRLRVGRQLDNSRIDEPTRRRATQPPTTAGFPVDPIRWHLTNRREAPMRAYLPLTMSSDRLIKSSPSLHFHEDMFQTSHSRSLCPQTFTVRIARCPRLW